jgi:hypothetical protein
MLGIGEYSGHLSMVMRSSEHISLEPNLEGPEYVLHHRLCLHWREMVVRSKMGGSNPSLGTHFVCVARSLRDNLDVDAAI